MTIATTLAFLSPGIFEIMVIGVVALLVFGGNLPDVMRTVGRSYAKFRQGLQDISKPVREELRKVREIPQKAASLVNDDDRRNDGNKDLYAPDPAENEPAGVEDGPTSETSEQSAADTPVAEDDDYEGVADEPPPI